jgi:hypothetical protein
MASLRPCRYIRVSAFDRFDEILYLVEKTSDFTLPDFVRCHFHVAIRRRDDDATRRRTPAGRPRRGEA